MPHLHLHRAPSIVLAIALGGVPHAAAAQDVQVTKGDCKTGVHLVARNVPVSKVLARLSQELGFELKFETSKDRPVDVDMKKPAPQLLLKLLAPENVIMDDAPDPNCPGLRRVTKLWVLPTGQEGPPRPRELTPMEQYRKAHGMPLEDPADKAAQPAATPQAAPAPPGDRTSDRPAEERKKAPAE